MDNQLVLFSLSQKIEAAFKSLIKSGRPDIVDDQNNNLIPQLYVDMYENDFILRQVLDDNHVLLKGRKGTGKSTIFLRAEQEISKDKHKISVYINLQSCYEEIKTANSDRENNSLTQYRTFYNFFVEIVKSITEKLSPKIGVQECDQIISDIEHGKYIDADFQRSIEVTNSTNQEYTASLNGSLTLSSLNASTALDHKTQLGESTTQCLHELRIFSIHEIINRIQNLLSKNKIYKVYLFLDDFSELNENNQKLVVDSLIAPIISSYNQIFKVKIAGYPSRTYLGNIDSSKLPTHCLDFYDVYEKSSSTYTQVEELAINYIERTLQKRIEVYTNSQIQISELFDLSKATLKDYLKTLFYSSAGIPRSLGYILTYCFLSSINQGRTITLSNIDNAAEKYYLDNILPDFFNDVRFKQSFYDDKNLLNQITQKNLLNKIVQKMQDIKRDVIDEYSSQRLKKQLFIETLQENKKTTGYWFPTSHFFIRKEMEPLLKTLELYFIVNKFHEGSSREPGKKISIYGLNYGLCYEKRIDYGKPASRRAYDYWRQDEFDLSSFIPSAISDVEVRCCSNCQKEYSDIEYSIYEKYHICFQCGKKDTVVTINKFVEKLQDNIKVWKEKSLPNLYIDILRTLYNHLGEELSAFEIGQQVDKHHLAITRSMDKLVSMEYVTYHKTDKRYYSITDTAVQKFFAGNVEI